MKLQEFKRKIKVGSFIKKDNIVWCCWLIEPFSDGEGDMYHFRDYSDYRDNARTLILSTFRASDDDFADIRFID